MAPRYFSLTFPEGLVKEPIFYSLVKKSGLMVNIYRADVTAISGWLVISLDGDELKIDEALLELKGRGATVTEGGPEILDDVAPPNTSGVRVRLTTPKEQVKEPVLSLLITQHDVVVNIRHAKVDANKGVIELEISGALSEIDQAIEFLRKRGITVAPIEGNVIE